MGADGDSGLLTLYGAKSTDALCIQAVPNCGVAAPNSISAAGGTGKITVSWSSSGGGTSFTLKRGTASGTYGTTVASGISGYSYNDTTVTNGTRYYYVVTATNSYGTSGNSSSASAYALAKPTLSSAVAGDAQVTLTWTAVTNATAYSIKRRTSPTGTITTISPGNVTTYTNTGLTNGTTYYYEVTATNTIGPSASDLSNQLSATPQPPAPTAPTLTGTPGDTTAFLSWTAPTNAVTYTLKRSTTSGSGYVAIPGVTATTSLTYLDIGLANNTSYYYVVTATNVSGTSPNSAQVAVKPIATPVLAAVAGTAKVNLSWPASAGATGYTIKRRLTPTGTVTTISPGNVTSYSDTTVVDGTLYYYTVAAVNATGTGNDSNQVQAKPIAAPTLSVTVGDAQASLSWTAPTGATSYTLKRSTTSGSGYVAIAGATNTTALSYIDTGLTNGTTYYYVVVANNATGASDNSVQVLVTPNPVPPIPTGLTATAGNAQITLTWATSTLAQSYTLKRSVGPTGTVTSIYVSLASGPPYTNTLLTNGTSYCYIVVATNQTGTSGDSAQVCATPLAPPAAPVLTLASLGDTKASFSWAAVSGATTYTLKRSTVSGSGYVALAGATATTSLAFTDTTAVNSNTYYYVVVANNASGTSANSNEEVMRPIATPTLTAVAGSAQVVLSWNASAGATTYTVKRSGTTGGPYSAVGSGITATTFTNTGLSNNVTYYYVVVANNATGAGEESNEVASKPVAAPTLTGTLGDNKVFFTWTASPGAVSYTLKRGTATGGPYADIPGATATTSLSFTDVGLSNNVVYYYVVVATNGTGTSPLSAQIAVRPIATPTIDPAVPGNAQVTLKWSASAGATSYTLKRGTSPGVYTTLIPNITVIPYVSSGLTNGTTYYYVVAAVNGSGTGEYSAEVSATPVAPPPTPTGLTATPGDTQVFLSWNASAGATSYTVKFGLSSGSSNLTACSGVTATSCTHTGLTNGTTYYYVVTATNAGGTSQISSQVSATPNIIPAAPLNLTAVPGNAQIALSWSASANATDYSLQRSLTVNGVTTTIQVGNVTSYTNTGLTNGQAYFYVVVATNSVGTSPKSNKVSATPQVPSSIVITLAPTPSLCSQQTVPSSVGVVEVRASSTISGGYPPYTAVWSPAPFWMSTSTSINTFLATYRYATTVESFATIVSPKIILTITDAAFGTASTSRNFVPCPSAVACKVP